MEVCVSCWPDFIRDLRAARKTGWFMLRRIFSARNLNALQNRKAQQHDCAYCNPMRGDVQYSGSINESAD